MRTRRPCDLLAPPNALDMEWTEKLTKLFTINLENDDNEIVKS